jgi:hypothetical protein
MVLGGWPPFDSPNMRMIFTNARGLLSDFTNLH